MNFVKYFTELNTKDHPLFEIAYFSNTAKGQKIIEKAWHNFQEPIFAAIINAGYVVKNGKKFVLVIPRKVENTNEFRYSLHYFNGKVVDIPCYDIRIKFNNADLVETKAYFFDEKTCETHVRTSTPESPDLKVDTLRRKFIEVDMWHWMSTSILGSRRRAFGLEELSAGTIKKLHNWQKEYIL